VLYPDLPVHSLQRGNLARLGLAATTNSGGANKWQDSLSNHLAGADVVILPDHDDAGRKHGEQVAKSLRGAKSIKIVDLPGLPDKGDVSQFPQLSGLTLSMPL
jgi:DNA primase